MFIFTSLRLLSMNIQTIYKMISYENPNEMTLLGSNQILYDTEANISVIIKQQN